LALHARLRAGTFDLELVKKEILVARRALLERVAAAPGRRNSKNSNFTLFGCMPRSRTRGCHAVSESG